MLRQRPGRLLAAPAMHKPPKHVLAAMKADLAESTAKLETAMPETELNAWARLKRERRARERLCDAPPQMHLLQDGTLRAREPRESMYSCRHGCSYLPVAALLIEIDPRLLFHRIVHKISHSCISTNTLCYEM